MDVVAAGVDVAVDSVNVVVDTVVVDAVEVVGLQTKQMFGFD